MDVHVIDLPKLTLAGFSGFVLQDRPGRIRREWPYRDRIWAHLLTFLASNSGQIPGNVNSAAIYEVRDGDVSPSDGEGYQIFVGYQVEKTEELPGELVVKQIPPGLHAEFFIPGEPNWPSWEREMVKKWFGTSGYERSGAYTIHVYEEAGGSSDHVSNAIVELFIPIQPSLDQPRLVD